MKTMLFVFSALTLATSASFAAVDCTKEPKEKWQNAETFQKDRVAEGYKIKKFKITSGNCYEIYGWNKEGKKIEIYFNPVDGSKVKEK